MKKIILILYAFLFLFVLCGCNTNETYNSENDLCEPQVGQILSEAYGNAEATCMIFDFANEIGYYPSAVFGPYCFDMRTHTVHNTDSDCVKQIPPESLLSCWVYDCYTLQSVKKTIKENQFLSTFDWEICPICVP